ncbi:MAG: phytanoyl-CoA dioxygenase family protein [Chitinophagaceae bacterium]|nr:phytanoyl-CoA dioxygenase family protein [Chitinophagaceae bacterium]
MMEFHKNGFAVINDFYSKTERNTMIRLIENAVTDKPGFRRSNDLFAIRQVLKEIPELACIVFNEKLKRLIVADFGENYFVSKSIYFDKPGQSNWFVAYHQDLTISVKEKTDLPGYGPFTKKQDQFAVQPPVAVLEKNFTIRIHLDDTDASNGVLRVIPASHLPGIRRIEEVDNFHEEVPCPVGEAGIMLMHPLLFHASGKSTSARSRRVLHIEFSNQELPEGLTWSERFDYSSVS